MELLRKYYSSLREATNYLEDLKQEYAWQKNAYDLICDRIQELPSGKKENLGELWESLKSDRRKRRGELGFLYALDNVILLEIVSLLNFFGGLAIPIFVPFMVAIFLFLIIHVNDVRQYFFVKENIKGIKNAKAYLSEQKMDTDLLDLLEQLKNKLGENEEYINNLKQAIDEYMSLLIEYENMPLTYESGKKAEEVKMALDDGLKKMCLCYRGDKVGENR